MDKLVDGLNKIFSDISNVKNITHNKTRKRLLTINDALFYRFYYSRLKTKKQESVSTCNYLNNYNVNRSSYSKKESNIKLDAYKYIYDSVCNVHDNLFPNVTTKIIAVDGSNSNTNLNNNSGIAEVSLNMGYYDITNNIPIDLTYNGTNRNTEIKQLKKYINENNITNVIIVADRAYFKYELFKFLEDRNIKYVIRIKDNSLIGTDRAKNNKLINEITKITRVIEYQQNATKVITLKNKLKKTIEIKSKYKLITNLTDKNKYTNEFILNTYKSRWEVELFFKLIKANFKFDLMYEKSEVQYKKLIYCELIIVNITKILIKIYNNESKDKFKRKLKTYTTKINESNIINGIYNTILSDIIYQKLTYTKICNFIESFVITYKNKINRSFERTAKTPFKKWYVKRYLNIYKYTKILDAIENKTINKLNKNLKLDAKNIKIINK